MAGRIPEYSHDIDHLVYPKDDLLRRDAIAKAVAREVVLAPPDETSDHYPPPSKSLVFGVYGSWGSGKSFLLSQAMTYLLEANRDERLRRELAGDNQEAMRYRYIAATFKAWAYETEKDLAPALVATLARLGDDPHQKKNPKLLDREFRDIGLGLAGLICDIAAAVSPIGGSLFKAAGNVIDHRVDSAAHHPERTEHPEINDRLWTEEVHQRMCKLVNGIIASAQKGNPGEKDVQYRLVIFIDDLDRCSPNNMLNLFEWLKNHLTVPNCVYVLALDHEAAARAVVGHYREYLGVSRDIAYGYRYLEKLVDLEWELEASPNVEYMAVRSSSQISAVSLSEMARDLLKRDFAGLAYIDTLMKLRSLRRPRTMLKITTKYRLAVELITGNEGRLLTGRMKLGHESLFWLALLTTMYYALEPYQLGEFCRGSGDVYRAFSGVMKPEELEQKKLDGPMLELCEYGIKFSRESNLTLPSDDQLRFLLAVIRENCLPIGD